MSHPRKRARRAALQALYQWQVTGQNVGDIRAQFHDEHAGSATDIEYFDEVLGGVTSSVDELDALFAPYLDRPVKELDLVERAILRLASFELAYRPDIPYRVVIDEGVELAKTFGADQSHKYINGVLDKVAHKARAVEIKARGRR